MTDAHSIQFATEPAVVSVELENSRDLQLQQSTLVPAQSHNDAFNVHANHIIVSQFMSILIGALSATAIPLVLRISVREYTDEWYMIFVLIIIMSVFSMMGSIGYRYAVTSPKISKLSIRMQMIFGTIMQLLRPMTTEPELLKSNIQSMSQLANVHETSDDESAQSISSHVTVNVHETSNNSDL